MVKTHKLTIDEVKGAREWSALEDNILAECAGGMPAYLPGREDLPGDTSDPDRRVRSMLVRYLLEGGCKSEGGYRPSSKGVTIAGGWFDEWLELDGVNSDLSLFLGKCLFTKEVTLMDAHLGDLFLNGSRVEKGLNLHRLHSDGPVHLTQEFASIGEVDLGFADIGGNLELSGGAIAASSDGGIAIRLSEAHVRGSVLLTEEFSVKGRVYCVGMKIDGQFSCQNAQFSNPVGDVLDLDSAQVGRDVYLRGPLRFDGNVDFSGAKVEGDVEVSGARINGDFRAGGMKTERRFIWLEVLGEIGLLNLQGARAGTLEDDLGSWGAAGQLELSGFRYDHIESSITVKERLAILRKKREWRVPFPKGFSAKSQPWINTFTTFDPQPYSQYAAVLQAQGARVAAAMVLMERERRLGQAAYRSSLARLDGTLTTGVQSLGAIFGRGWDHMFRLLFGYGHRPARVFLALVPFWCGVAALYGYIYSVGQMAPNSDVVLTSADWLAAVATGAKDGVAPMFVWTGEEGYVPKPSYEDYETFSAWLYAADLFIPLDAIGQESTWSPSHDRGFWGQVGYWARFPIQMTGWIIAAVGAAVVTGLVGKKE